MSLFNVMIQSCKLYHSFATTSRNIPSNFKAISMYLAWNRLLKRVLNCWRYEHLYCEIFKIWWTLLYEPLVIRFMCVLFYACICAREIVTVYKQFTDHEKYYLVFLNVHIFTYFLWTMNILTMRIYDIFGFIFCIDELRSSRYLKQYIRHSSICILPLKMT